MTSTRGVLLAALLTFSTPLLLAFSCDSAERPPSRPAPVTTELKVNLLPVADGFAQPTDIQFIQSDGEEHMVVLQQGGEARWRRMADSQTGVLFQTEVLSGGELGLLGIAFHPKFAENGLFYINRTVHGGRAALSRVDEWRLTGASVANAPATFVRNIMEVDQPYRNHNAGQLQFGPDGFLYIGWGDGGAGGDPEDNAQDPSSLLGKMLRIDIDRKDPGKPYAIPADNPFVGREGFQPEIWAMGLRNPWRFSFDPRGRLVVADVGQNRIEEISIVEAGKNYGWDALEGTQCFEPPSGCNPERYAPPIYEYSRSEGFSVTGGYVYTGDSIPTLKGKYVFGDLNGTVWAMDLPEDASTMVKEVSVLVNNVNMPTTFGRDSAGEVYVAAYNTGTIYRLVRE